MEKRIQIGLVGDFSEKIHTHVALNESIKHCRAHLSFNIETSWIPTEKLSADFLTKQKYNGFWIVPGSPYNNDAGVLQTIRWARENNFPIFGTCGGFQYMVVEYARNVLCLKDAGHQESEPNAQELVISKLTCSLKGQREEIKITDKASWLYQVLKTDRIIGHFFCSYGVNPFYQKTIDHYPMAFTAFSPDGEARALEIKDHRFFKGVLFQPPLDSHQEKPNPLLISFFQHCAAVV